LKVNVVFRFR